MTHSIFLSSVRIESHRHHSSRSGEAPAVPSAGLATQRWDRGEEPNLKHRQLARSPWGRAEPGLPGCSETTSTALWAQLPPPRPAYLTASSCCWSGLRNCCDPEHFQLCQRHLITVKTNTAYDRLGLSPVTTDRGQCIICWHTNDTVTKPRCGEARRDASPSPAFVYLHHCHWAGRREAQRGHPERHSMR